MGKIISLVIVLLPCAAFAATDCRIVEYADHYEAVCVGTAELTPATRITVQEQVPVQEENLAPAQTAEQLDLPPEQIVRNDLARLHGDYWLKRNAR